MLPNREKSSHSLVRWSYVYFMGAPRQLDLSYWVLACLFAAGAGYCHVRLNDSGLSVLAITAATMFLAYMRPQRVWRWVLVMGLSLPVATLIAGASREQPSLGMIAGSFAGLAFAIVAAIGGQVLRRVVGTLFPPKNVSAPERKQ